MVAKYFVLIASLLLALSTAAPSKNELENQVPFWNAYLCKKYPFCVYVVYF